MDKPFYSIPSGVRELFPPLPTISRKIEQEIMEFFSLYGYEEISTPVFMYELHMRNNLFEPFESTFFKLTDRNTGETLVLRPDVSLQILQMVLNKRKKLLPLRFSYAEDVYRDMPPQAGLMREFRQIGVELLGLKELEGDAEIIEVVSKVFKKIGINDLVLRLGNTEIINTVVKTKDEKLKKQLISAFSKKNFSLAKSIMKEKKMETADLIDVLSSVTEKDQIKKINVKGELKTEIDKLVDLLDIIQVDDSLIKVFLDLLYCENTNYHRGISFEIYAKNMGQPLCVGGRYGKITEFLGEYIPATGFTLNLDRVVQSLNIHKIDKKTVFVIDTTKDKKQGRRICEILREKGIPSVRDIIKRNVTDSLVYAKKMEYKWCLIVEKDIEIYDVNREVFIQIDFERWLSEYIDNRNAVG
ncbi:MAG: ATP phosphoribosyltransferase regulatory subunit [Campylobacterota bacterium]|nr:ATP phosphoribosyltransferase regulatory subunit [Campylobacterota bacterium]